MPCVFHTQSSCEQTNTRPSYMMESQHKHHIQQSHDTMSCTPCVFQPNSELQFMRVPNYAVRVHEIQQSQQYLEIKIKTTFKTRHSCENHAIHYAHFHSHHCYDYARV